MDVEVLSYDPMTDQIVPRKVVNWFNNGPAEQFLQFTVEKSGGNGQVAVRGDAQPPHPHSGWLDARPETSSPAIGVLAAEPHRAQRSAVPGRARLADGRREPVAQSAGSQRRPLPAGTRRQAGRSTWSGRPHCWATSSTQSRENAKGARFVDFTPLPELRELQRAVYLGDGKKFLSEEYLKALTPLALAIWYMDDGSFSVRSKGLQQRTAWR